MGARILETYHRIQRLSWFCLWKRLRPESGSPLWPTLSIFFFKEICFFFSMTLTHSAHFCVLHIKPHKDWLHSWLVQILNFPKWKWEWLCVGHMCPPYPISCVHGERSTPLWRRGLSKCWRAGQVFITRSIAQKERCAPDWLASGTGLGYKTWLQAKLSSHLTGRPLGAYSWSSARCCHLGVWCRRCNQSIHSTLMRSVNSNLPLH